MLERPPEGFRRCSRCGWLKPVSSFRKRRLPRDRRLDPSACVTCNGHTREYVAWQKRSHRLVQEAVRSGRLVRPDRCTECRKVRPLEAHHWRGYRFPLTVRWLCPSCHRYAEGPERMSGGFRQPRHSHTMWAQPNARRPNTRRWPLPAPDDPGARCPETPDLARLGDPLRGLKSHLTGWGRSVYCGCLLGNDVCGTYSASRARRAAIEIHCGITRRSTAGDRLRGPC